MTALSGCGAACLVYILLLRFSGFKDVEVLHADLLDQHLPLLLSLLWRTKFEHLLETSPVTGCEHWFHIDGFRACAKMASATSIHKLTSDGEVNPHIFKHQ